jgi:mannose-6-phosphate isomerase-like protein (cupin superfamily)
LSAAGDLEEIRAGDSLLAYVIRAGFRPPRTDFLTPDDLTLQVGHIVYPAGSEIPRHFHRPVKREFEGTSEVLLVREGRCSVDIFDSELVHAETIEIGKGDVLVLVAGGHGLTMLEPTLLLEIKQGPYVGLDEKQRF